MNETFIIIQYLILWQHAREYAKRLKCLQEDTRKNINKITKIIATFSHANDHKINLEYME